MDPQLNLTGLSPDVALLVNTIYYYKITTLLWLNKPGDDYNTFQNLNVIVYLSLYASFKMVVCEVSLKL